VSFWCQTHNCMECFLFALLCTVKPNKSVKGTRRPLAVLEFGFYPGSAASLKLSERRAPYLCVRLSGVRVSGFSLHSSALMLAGSFLVCFGLPLPTPVWVCFFGYWQVCSINFTLPPPFYLFNNCWLLTYRATSYFANNIFYE